MQHNPATPHTQRPAAFDSRLMAHVPMLKRLARKIPPQKREDAIQQTICLALERWSEFAETGSFHKWLGFKFLHAVEDRARARKEVEDADGKYSAGLLERARQEAEVDVSLVARRVMRSEILSSLVSGGTISEFAQARGVSIQAAAQMARRHRAKYLGGVAA